MLLALGFTEDIAQEIVLDCLKAGLLVNPVKPNALRFMPALTVTREEVAEALRILDKVLTKFA